MRLPHILLLDNDPAVCAALQFSLGIEGYDVEAFESVDALSKAACPYEATCLVIDHRLPILDGLATLMMLRARGITVPAVVTTTNPSRATRAKIREAGAILVEKPLLGEALVNALRTLIPAHQTNRVNGQSQCTSLT